jgi:hypothetical protein
MCKKKSCQKINSSQEYIKNNNFEFKTKYGYTTIYACEKSPSSCMNYDILKFCILLNEVHPRYRMEK